MGCTFKKKIMVSPRWLEHKMKLNMSSHKKLIIAKFLVHNTCLATMIKTKDISFRYSKQNKSALCIQRIYLINLQIKKVTKKTLGLRQ